MRLTRRILTTDIPAPGRLASSRCLSLLFLGTATAAALVSGCRTDPPSDDAAEVVSALYEYLVDNRVSGAPAPEHLGEIGWLLSPDLQRLLEEARSFSRAAAARHPEEKPPFVEGDLFSSLFEGPTRFDMLSTTRVGSSRHVAVHFSDERQHPAVEWIDTVVVREQEGQLLVSDVIYGGPWAFAAQGRLVGSIQAALRSDDSLAWKLRLDGIGPVRIGMSIADVELILDSSANVDRIEPSDTCGLATLAAAPNGVYFMLAGDTVVAVNVVGPGLADESGFGVGSTEEDVMASWGDAIRVEPHPYTGQEGHYLILEDPALPGLRKILETDHGTVTAMRAGRIPEVDFIEGCA